MCNSQRSHSMRSRVYVPVRCPSVCQLVCLSHLLTTAATCGEFATGRPLAKSLNSTALSSKCGHCHICRHRLVLFYGGVVLIGCRKHMKTHGKLIPSSVLPPPSSPAASPPQTNCVEVAVNIFRVETTARKRKKVVLIIHRVKWRHLIYGHDTFVILWV